MAGVELDSVATPGYSSENRLGFLMDLSNKCLYEFTQNLKNFLCGSILKYCYCSVSTNDQTGASQI